MEPTVDASGLYRPALEASPIAILIADPHGHIALVNRQFERLFGYGRAELVGQPTEIVLPEAFDLVPGPDPEATEAVPVNTRREPHARRKDGSTIAVDVRLQPIRTAESLFVLASVDVAERTVADTHPGTLEEHLEFERTVSELSLQFINLEVDQVQEAIRDGLGRMSCRLGLDRSSFCRLDDDGVLTESITWSTPGLQPADWPLPSAKLFPWTITKLAEGEIVAFARLDDIPSETDRTSYQACGTKSGVVLPLSVDRRVIGAVAFETVHGERRWSGQEMHRLKVIGSVFGQVLARQSRDEAMRIASHELRRLRDQLEVENVYLRSEERERLGLTRVVGQSPAIRRVLEQVQQVAATDATVLLRGETGTGKELFATYIHELGSRHARAMVRVNCAAIPVTLIESELFGREKGAFTGSLSRQVGRFELADHSTIFLDEIGDLPADVQVKLLRVLEERTIERLGSPRPITVDTRIVTATHRNLEQRIAEGLFREDLYYRLNVFPIHVPPLRERVEDIPLLLSRFVEEFSKAFGKRIDDIDKETITALQHYAWPGNIRELRNVVERAMILSTGSRLSIAVPPISAAATRRSPKLLDVEREHIRSVLESTGWRIRGNGGAADRLGLKPTTLETRMAKLGLRRPGQS